MELPVLYGVFEDGKPEDRGFDYAESYYHGFLTGLLKNNGRYSVLSNRENGNGRPDLILKEKKFMGRAIIIELKAAKSFAEMGAKCEEALAQIDAQDYAAPLAADGYRPIVKYGVALYKKGCIIKKKVTFHGSGMRTGCAFREKVIQKKV